MMSVFVRRWLVALSVFLFLLSSGIVFVIFFEPLFQWSIGWFGLQMSTAMSTETLMHNYHVLIQYLTRPWISNLVMPDFPSSAQGLFHFMEVKRLFMVDFVVFAISGVTSVWSLRYLYRGGQLWQLLAPLRVLFLVPIVVVVALVSFFDVIFVKFHEVFFHNSAWIFDPRMDPIIEALPEQFFMLCFVIVFVWLLVGLGGVYVWAKRKNSKDEGME